MYAHSIRTSETTTVCSNRLDYSYILLLQRVWVGEHSFVDWKLWWKKHKTTTMSLRTVISEQLLVLNSWFSSFFSRKKWMPRLHGFLTFCPLVKFHKFGFISSFFSSVSSCVSEINIKRGKSGEKLFDNTIVMALSAGAKVHKKKVGKCWPAPQPPCQAYCPRPSGSDPPPDYPYRPPPRPSPGTAENRHTGRGGGGRSPWSLSPPSNYAYTILHKIKTKALD